MKTKCPRCGGGVPNDLHPGAYPGALSRWDNKTEICSACGSDEAMLQLGAVLEKKDAHAVLDPITGFVPWIEVPGGK